MQNENRLPTEKDLLSWLGKVGDRFSPLCVRLVKKGPIGPTDIDALVDVSWGKQEYRFACELRALSTPKAVDSAIDRIKSVLKTTAFYPLVVTPYLSEENLRRLEQSQTSGLDLCGNGILQVPGTFVVKRSGEPNNFPRGTLIQNVYRGASSQVARAFLLKPNYDATQDLLEELEDRGATVTLSTVSKVCSALEEDLIIERVRKERTTRLRLLQPEKLLDALSAHFVLPRAATRFVGKCSFELREMIGEFRKWQDRGQGQIVRTGSDSATEYATMAREPISRFYCSALPSLVSFLGTKLVESPRFPNIELIQTAEPSAYFDSRDRLLASPIQCYLELHTGDKREQETSEQVRTLLLKNLRRGNESF